MSSRCLMICAPVIWLTCFIMAISQFTTTDTSY